jgi:predicted nucleotidyltransferase
VTPYGDVNAVLTQLSDGLTTLLGEQLIGLYLTGSLTYGDFDPGGSDIDFLAVLDSELADEQAQDIMALHERIGAAFLRWAKRLEGSYITRDMITSKNRPDRPRLYVNGGKINYYRYGSEWTINCMRCRSAALGCWVLRHRCYSLTLASKTCAPPPGKT